MSSIEHLEIREIIAAIFASVLAELWSGFLKEEKIVEKHEAESDYPNSDLYFSRKKQLENFLPILKQQKKEPYALMISGEWGSGKSSFVKALEKIEKEDIFIWIETGSEKSVSEIMAEISEEIVDALKKNNVLVEREDVIERYFCAFSKVLEEAKLSFFNSILDMLKSKEPVNEKVYLNNRLKELEDQGKGIYLIIDDLDRCDKEYQLKMFKVIRESTKLSGCKTIFLVDKNEFLGGEYKQNNVDKYVNYILELCEVGYEEIVGYVIDRFLKEGFISGMSDVLLKGKTIDDLKKMIYSIPTDILKELEKEAGDIENKCRNAEPKEIDRMKEKVERLQETIAIIKRNITNSRKVKNFLRDIVRDIEKVNTGVEECSEEYQKEDWLDSIIRAGFVKNITPHLYNEIQMKKSLLSFETINSMNDIKVILELKYFYRYGNEGKIKILNDILFNLDTLDFREIKLKREKYLEQLRSGKGVIKDITEYVKYAQNSDDIKKIIRICDNQAFENPTEREEFVEAILKSLSNQISIYRKDTEDFLALSYQVIDCLRGLNLTENEKKIYENETNGIVRMVFLDNFRILKRLLYMKFDVTTVDKYWQTIDTMEIAEVFKILRKIDNNITSARTSNKQFMLEYISGYFESVMKDLENRDYDLIGLDFDEIRKRLSTMFRTCDVWLKKEVVLKRPSNQREEKFNKYFTVNNVNYYKEIAFLDISNLMEALEALKTFYEGKQEDYKSNYSLLLCGMARRIVLLYEKDPTWFNGEEKRINDLLFEMMDNVCDLDQSEDEDDISVLDEIRIMVYKMREHCNVRIGR